VYRIKKLKKRPRSKGLRGIKREREREKVTIGKIKQRWRVRQTDRSKRRSIRARVEAGETKACSY
jgi:hypothetical protein